MNNLIDQADSVEAIHFNHDLNNVNLTYATKKLAPSEYRDLRKAFPIRPDYEPSDWVDFCGFDPHHKIVITFRDGKTSVISFCFLCDAWQIDDGPVLWTPYAWRQPLRDFFARNGMPEKSLDAYLHDSQKARDASH